MVMLFKYKKTRWRRSRVVGFVRWVVVQQGQSGVKKHLGHLTLRLYKPIRSQISCTPGKYSSWYHLRSWRECQISYGHMIGNGCECEVVGREIRNWASETGRRDKCRDLVYLNPLQNDARLFDIAESLLYNLVNKHGKLRGLCSLRSRLAWMPINNGLYQQS